METATHDALKQLRLALMLTWCPPTVKENVPAWAAVKTAIASPIVMVEQSSRVILASRFQPQEARAKNDALNVM
jgi:hypothetical protein